MELGRYVALLRRWWWLLLVAGLLGGMVGNLLSRQLPPSYEARATLLVVDQVTPGVSRGQDLATSAALAQTFSELITLRPILEEVRVRGGFDLSVSDIRGSVRVSQQEGTQFIRLTAAAEDAVVARDIANVLAEVFIASPTVQLTNREATLSLVEPAVTPGAPVSPNVSANTAIAAALSVLVAFGVALLLMYIDDTVKTPAQVIEAACLSTIGRIEPFGRARPTEAQLPTAHRPASAAAESYRALRTNLLYSFGATAKPRGKLILVTSAGTGDGKTTTAANLAVALGLAGHIVVLVDADLRRPALHRLLESDNSIGLANLLLSDSVPMEQAVRMTPYERVRLAASGPLPPNPAELLGSARMGPLLARLREDSEFVIVDTPPVLGVTDATVLAQFADAIVLVAKAGRTRTTDLRAAVEDLAKSGTPIAGVVLNADSAANARRYYGAVEAPASSAIPSPAVTHDRDVRS
jgi:capsular exopolysaccharide synthesis family protein